MNEVYKLRAHHGMCLQFFIGKGYSSTFVENMIQQKQCLENNNSIVKIICGLDTICKDCPNNIFDKRCITNNKVMNYDQKVLEYCELEEHVEINYKDFINIVHDKIISQGLRENICGNCKWNDLCKEIENSIK